MREPILESFSLADWLAWMEAHHPRQIELGLDRIRAVYGRLALGGRPARVVTVGGTNGKGSCATLLEAMLRAAGQRVGVYTSPHLLRYNERVRIDGVAVSDADLCCAFRAVHAALADVSLTYFEFGTLAALWLFDRAGLDVWVLEVGLGGRLDAVNCIDADVAVLTTIDLDHQDWLGDDRETIGREKAGIFRPGRWAICVDAAPPQSVTAVAADLGSRLLLLGAGIDVAVAGEYWDWHADLPGQPTLRHLPLPQLPLASAVAALTALHALGFAVSGQAVCAALQQTRLSGRFERIERDGVEIFLDVAHNPQAATHLAQQLGTLPAKPLHAVFEIMSDKDAGGIIEPLLPLVGHWYLGALADNPRAAAPAALAAALRQRGARHIEVSADIAAALHAACGAAGGTGRVVVFGSFFTVAAALQQLTASATGVSCNG